MSCECKKTGVVQIDEPTGEPTGDGVPTGTGLVAFLRSQKPLTPSPLAPRHPLALFLYSEGVIPNCFLNAV